MADTVTVDNAELGSYVVSTDDAGVDGHVQRFKLAYSADGIAAHVPADANGLLVNRAKGATANLSSVSDSASSTTIKIANPARQSVTITNDSSARLYLGYTSGSVSTTVYSFSLAQHETVVIDDYTGQINGIWASDPGDGGARITEVA